MARQNGPPHRSTVRRDARDLKDSRRLARRSIWWACSFWIAFGVSGAAYHAFGYVAPPDGPLEFNFGTTVLLVVSVAASVGALVAGLAGVFTAVIALVKGGLTREVVMALLASVPLVVFLAAYAVMQLI